MLDGPSSSAGLEAEAWLGLSLPPPALLASSGDLRRLCLHSSGSMLYLCISVSKSVDAGRPM